MTHDFVKVCRDAKKLNSIQPKMSIQEAETQLSWNILSVGSMHQDKLCQARARLKAAQNASNTNVHQTPGHSYTHRHPSVSLSNIGMDLFHLVGNNYLITVKHFKTWINRQNGLDQCERHHSSPGQTACHVRHFRDSGLGPRATVCKQRMLSLLKSSRLCTHHFQSTLLSQQGTR